MSAATAPKPAMKIHREDIAPSITGDIGASQAAADQRNADLREAAKKGVAAVMARRAGEVEEPTVDPVQFPQEPVENIESLVLGINGKEVEYGPRRGSTVIALANILGSNPNQSIGTLVSTLLWVRSIDGQEIAMPANMVDIQKLANELGDEGCDILMVARNKYWPGVSRDSLPVLKKNLR